jgi:uncharacterized protein (TIGR02285 family)
MKGRGLFAALSLIFCLPVSAKEMVTWFIDPGFPPAYIASGPYAGMGLVDKELAWLIAHLPQFDHKVVNSTAPRSWHEIDRKDARCIAAALKSPAREKLAAFSAPALKAWGLMLLVRNDRLAQLSKLHGPSGDIDLSLLFGDSSLHRVISSGRGYGPVIDALVATAEGQQAVWKVPDPLQSLRMVSAGRADYTIG